MSFLQTLTEFIESIFKRSSPEVQKKQQMKKLEAEVKSFSPTIYQDGKLHPNFAEAIFQLYKNSLILDDLFSVTVGTNDIPRQHRFEGQLIITGYSEEYQQYINSLSFENRKNEILSESGAVERIYMRQRKNLEKVLKELNSESFKEMDRDILRLRQLVDFCKIGYVPILQVFDVNFKPNDLYYKPSYNFIEITKAVNLLEDLYYQTYNLKISTSIADQVVALLQLKKGRPLIKEETDDYIHALKKINYVLTKIFTSERLKLLIRIAKQNALYEPDFVKYSGSPRQEFANLLQAQFDAEEQRIKSEIQDELITSEVNLLFKNGPLERLVGYNAEANEEIQNNSSLSFMWILPMRILKTFLRQFINSNVKNLLNDIMIEGFFNNPKFKTEFSTIVFNAQNAASTVQEFEDSFADDRPNSIAVIRSYIKDSHKDKDFYHKLEKMVITVNNESHKLLQTITNNLFSLYKTLGELLADAKKPSSEIITNLKLLMFSSRNRDNTNILESQYENWKIFFEIMKNYVIINSGEIE